MGAAENKQKNSKMASDLVARGIYHGRRMTTPSHNNNPSLQDAGSAAHKRRTVNTGQLPVTTFKPMSLKQAIESARAHGIDHAGRARAGVS